MTYGKSTYSSLIEVLQSDVPNVELKRLTDETFMDWLLRAEERICRVTTVRDMYVLRLSVGVTDYALKNRPPISALTNTSPVTATATAHGLTHPKRVHITGTQGNNQDGDWFTTAGATPADQFILNPGAYISNIEVVTAGLKITTETPHGFINGQSVTHANVTAPSAVNGTQVITLIDDTSYSIALSPADPTYTNDGLGVAYALMQSSGNGAYTGGGRFSVDSELPTYVSKILSGSTKDGNVLYPLEGDQIDGLNRDRDPLQDRWSHPSFATIFIKNGQKFLRVDPVPSKAIDVTLSFEVQISPREHYNETSDLYIHLSSEFDPMILAFMKARAFERLGDMKLMSFYDSRFDQFAGEYNLNLPDGRINVSYT